MNVDPGPKLVQIYLRKTLFKLNDTNENVKVCFNIHSHISEFLFFIIAL